MKICVIGAGVIGAGWVARFVLNGIGVAVFDLDTSREIKMREVLALAKKSFPHLYDRMLPEDGHLTVHSTLADAVQNADWIQESLPENLELKRKIYREIFAVKKESAIVASSTSGFKPSHLTEGITARDGTPAQIVVAHPFHPVYLLPLVEIVLEENDRQDELYCRIETLMTSIGMSPLRVRTEIDGHIADRLLEALWREALWLVHDGIATTEEIDDAIRLGFGLRWAQMGLFETYRLGGGEKGMRHFIAQFGQALQWPWTKLMDTPTLDDVLIDKIANQSDKQSGHMTIRELETLRDRNLVGIMRSLKNNKSGVGKILADHEASLPKVRSDRFLPITAKLFVLGAWMDSNGHMNEVYYLEVANRATTSFLESIGVNDTYIKSGGSYFAVETKQQYVKELLEGAYVEVETQVLELSGKKLRLYHSLKSENGDFHCGVETLLLHIDMNKRRSTEPPDWLYERLRIFAKKHEGLTPPKGYSTQ